MRSSLSKRLLKFYQALEQKRISIHLQIVEKELRQKNVELLPPWLQAERQNNLDCLHTYWKNGVFPKNTDFPDRRIPYFVDKKGIPCAMAYLVGQSGNQDLVKQVAATNNHVYISNIKNGPVLDWIYASGLTREEAARVQPSYGRCGLAGCPNLFLTQLVPLIISAVVFILAEVVSYKISSWLSQGNPSRRLISWLYFTPLNIYIAIFTFYVYYFLSAAGSSYGLLLPNF